MAVTIAELISLKDDLKNKRKALYDLETSIGTLTVRTPDSETIADTLNISDVQEANAYLIVESVVEPSLKDKELLKAYNCAEPLEIASAIFQPGEIARLATAILELAGFDNSNKIVKKLHSDIKSAS